MPKLIKQDNLKLQKPKVIIIDSNTSIIDVLLNNFEYLPHESTTILLNDELVLHTDTAKLKSKLADNDILTVYHEVKEIMANIAGQSGTLVTKDISLTITANQEVVISGAVVDEPIPNANVEIMIGDVT